MRPGTPPEAAAAPSLHERAGRAEPARRAAAPRRETTGDRPPTSHDLQGLDELYVDNAGLVLVWPFLDRFLQRTGLLAEGARFVDEDCRAQAVTLLDALVTATHEPFEPRLPLAKLLCGWPPHRPLPPAAPPSPEHLAEGETMLRALLDHAAVLRDLSPAELRPAFLQRRGALTVLHGSWLLRVERRAQDDALARLPWSLGWIRRPWMPHLLRVEW